MPHQALQNQPTRTRKRQCFAFLGIGLAALSIAGCSSVDRIAMTSLEPATVDGVPGFKFRARSDAIRPENNAEAEAERMRWLQTYLDDNAMCKSGFVIAQRQAVMISDALFGRILDIFYTGTCKG